MKPKSYFFIQYNAKQKEKLQNKQKQVKYMRRL